MTKSRGILAPRLPWSDDAIELLTRLYPDTLTAEIAKQLGMSVSRVYSKANQMGLKKSEAYLASPAACRLRRGDNVGAAHRFKSGQQAWNNGMKGLQIGGEATQFKPGAMPHNTLPIGSHRLDMQGTLQRKISEDKGSNSKRWRGVHELVWISANGPVPPKHIVVFKPGQRTNVLEEITIDKVECISLAENMKRNTVHNLPQELAAVVLLRAAIVRKINKRTSKNEQ